MLKFIGMGSAFNTDLGNNSAFIHKEESFLLIDCGGMVFHRLQELRLLDGIKDLYVIITHMHSDHVGSLGDLIFYTYYILKNKVTVMYPNKEYMASFLQSIGVEADLYHFKGSSEAELKDRFLGEIEIRYIPVSHVETIEAYGFILNIGQKKIYYSGDANHIPEQISKKLKVGEFDSIYQDTCGLDYEGNSHLSFNKLKQLIDKKDRGRVYCMHLDSHITKEELISEGFKTAELVIE